MSATTAPRRRCISATTCTMMMLYWLQQSGNKPITLMGGGTTMVGDPSGKDEIAGASASIEEIEANKACDHAACSPKCCATATARRRRQSCSTMPNG